MSRTIFTDPFPRFTTTEIPKDAVVITPHVSVAERLGVPFRSLRGVAQNILKEKGTGVASPLVVLHTLKSAIRSVLNTSNESAEAGRIREMLATVLRSGLDIEKIRQHGSPRIKIFAEIANRYVKKLRQLNLIDGEAVLTECCKIEFPPQKVFIFGYFRARPVLSRLEEIEFIDKFSGDGSAYYLPCSEDPIFSVNREWVNRLAASGWKTISSKSDSEIAHSAGMHLAAKFGGRKLPDDLEIDASNSTQTSLPFLNVIESDRIDQAALVYPNIEAEVRGTLGTAKNLIVNGALPEKIAFVCRNENLYSPIIASVAREYGLSVDMTQEVAIRETAFGNFINLLIETKQSSSDSDQNGDFKFETTTRMLRHRYGPGITDDKWPEIRKSYTRGFERWTEAVDTIKHLASPEKQTQKAWVDWLKNVFLEFNIRETTVQDASEQSAHDCFTEALNDLSGFEEDREQTFENFAANIFELLADFKIPYSPASGGIRPCQPNTILACEFEHVFVIGLAEGMLPEAVVENTVIDFYERKQLTEHGIHFEDATEVPRWETLSFYFVLLAAAKSVTLSYPRHIDREEKLPSAFFERLGLKPIEAAKQFVSSVEEQRRAFLTSGEALAFDSVFSEAKRQFDVENRRESDQPCDEYDGVIGVGVDAKTWSASSLAKIGSCPFKWFADKALKLGVPEEAEIDLLPSTKGSLYHKTLEIAVRRSMGAADLRAAVLEHLDAAFAEAESSDKFSLHGVENWELRRGEHLDTLRNAICSDAFIGEGSLVLEVEKKFKTEWNGLQLTGTIDRIDETADGLMAVDYKTGSHTSKVKDGFGKLKVDLQLPIYSQAALPKLYPNRVIAPGIYMRIAKGEADVEKPVELGWFAESVKAILAEGRFAVNPDIDEAACKYCEYDSVCRRGPRVARKTK